MTQQEFKKGNLMFSGKCESKENLEQKISEKIYYNSKIHLTMFELNRGVQWFYLVNHKGINRKKIVRLDSKGMFKYRYL